MGIDAHRAASQRGRSSRAIPSTCMRSTCPWWPSRLEQLDALPADARLHRRVGVGEMLTDLDLTAVPGPAARAAPGTVVVALTDPLSRGVSIGLEVQVAADGMVIAESATVVEMIDDVVFVAVDASTAATVARCSPTRHCLAALRARMTGDPRRRR